MKLLVGVRKGLPLVTMGVVNTASIIPSWFVNELIMNSVWSDVECVM